MSILQHQPPDQDRVQYAPCQVCGCYHRVRNPEEICCHCDFRRTQARKQALPWLGPT